MMRYIILLYLQKYTGYCVTDLDKLLFQLPKSQFLFITSIKLAEKNVFLGKE